MLTIIPHASSSAGNLYILNNGRSRLIIELGIPWRKVSDALNFDLSGVAGAIVFDSFLGIWNSKFGPRKPIRNYKKGS